MQKIPETEASNSAEIILNTLEEKADKNNRRLSEADIKAAFRNFNFSDAVLKEIYSFLRSKHIEILKEISKKIPEKNGSGGTHRRTVFKF